MGLLDGKIAVVTGAAQGLGTFISHRLAREGADLVLGDINEEGVGAAAQAVHEATGRTTHSVKVDVSREADGDTLWLDLRGSSEHGCSGLLDARLRVIPTGEQMEIQIELHGAPYLALPPAGSVRALDADGSHRLQLEDIETSVVFTDLETLHIDRSSLGSLEIEAHGILPWFQLQHHASFTEGDVDHSCELEGVEGISMTLRASL